MEIGNKSQAKIYFAQSLQPAGLEIFQPFKYNKLLLVPRVDCFFFLKIHKKKPVQNIHTVLY